MKTHIFYLSLGMWILSMVDVTYALDCNRSPMTHEVKMLNYDASTGQIMAFDPAVLHVCKGDSIKWVSTDPGHNSVSLGIPEKANAWSSEVSEDYTYKFDYEGTYFYVCEPHAMLGMLGIVVVKTPSDQALVNQQVADIRGKFPSASRRLDEYLKAAQTLK